ncbi:hypothetical protein HMPREF9241_01169 [Schaalia turicensis ACS-279-V-Col4]|uniref:Uncharacterized protein n=1 Tax=Schaalia turicensis ACS-279-V-Col4 TaxID=883077 RepID=K0ZDV4_9ACTO|nr:hypothetical protein HMPREF9241_01169 [Schaalia turicensis ACS-279-V-Col4]
MARHATLILRAFLASLSNSELFRPQHRDQIRRIRFFSAPLFGSLNALVSAVLRQTMPNRMRGESDQNQQMNRCRSVLCSQQPLTNLLKTFLHLLLPDANIAWGETQIQASIGKQQIPLLILRVARCRSLAGSLILHVLRNLANVECQQPRLLFNAFNHGVNQRMPSLRKRRFVTL